MAAAHRGLVALTVAGVATLTACGGGGTTTWYGAVTALEPQFCVGRPAATGGCFAVTALPSAASLRAGQCVKLTFRPSSSRRPQLISLQPVDAAGHRRDCPAD
jgi:hypothetical protein